MANRLALQELLEATLGSDNVYFQPPSSNQMEYPCIVYIREAIITDFAGNMPYSINKKYQLTVMDRNPDSLIPDKVAALPGCIFDRHFTAAGLNHDVFTISF